MENRDRMEFAIEKCTELGMTTCIPLATHHSPRRALNSERLHAKALSAMLQCKRARLPHIHAPHTFVEWLATVPQNALIILGSAEGTAPIHSVDMLRIDPMRPIICVVGAEGGLHEEELRILRTTPCTLLEWNIGGRRLRAETAAMSLCAVVMSMV